MPRPKKHVKQAQAAVNLSSNTSNTLANPPPNVPPQPTDLLPNQNLQNSAASAAALPLLQQINSTSTNANIDTSHSEAMDTSHSLMPQASQPALLINQQQNLLLSPNSNAVKVLGLMPQALEPGFQIHSTNNSNDMDIAEPMEDISKIIVLCDGQILTVRLKLAIN